MLDASEGPDFALKPNAKPPILPWILFGVALLGGIGASIMQMQKADAERTKAVAAQKAADDARAKVTELETVNKNLETHVRELEAEKDKEKAKASAPAPAAAAPAAAPAKGGKAAKKAPAKKHHKH
jgi:hypothetical protein